MNTKKIVLTALLGTAFLASCSSSEEVYEPKGTYDLGVLVSNEGAFSGGTGTINYISDDYNVEESKVYKNVNGEDLGTIVQSIGFKDEEAFIVANVANKISVANRYTMKKIASIESDLVNPRFIAFANGKGYITNWGAGSDTTDDYVAVLDLATYKVVKKISVVEGPEQIVAKNNKLYITHKGGWGTGNSVTVIDASSDSVVTNITVGDKPDELFFDNSGNLIVSCEGKAITSWNPNELLAKLVKINTTDNTVTTTMTFASGIHPNVMLNYGSNIYYAASGKIYEMSQTATDLPTSELISTTSIKTMAIKEGKLYTTDALDNNSNGKLKIFDLTTKNELKEFTVGLIPAKIYFN